MKTLLILAAAAAAAACTAVPQPSGTARVRFSLALDGASKAVDLGADKAVRDVAVWMWRDATAATYASAAADYFAYSPDGSDVAVSCTEGTYYVKALANLPEGLVDPALQGSASYRDPSFAGRLFSLSEFDGVFRAGAVPMLSVDDDALHRRTVSGSTSLTLTMTRPVVKVTVDCVTDAVSGTLPPEGGEPRKPVIRSLYLINGSSRFSFLTGAARKDDVSDCYSCSALYDPGALWPDFGQGRTPWCTRRQDIGGTVVDGTADLSGAPLYTAATDVEAGLPSLDVPLDELEALASWPLHKTRVVLECLVGGRVCYYAQDLPAAPPGTWIHWSGVTLTQKGTLSPDQVILPSDVTITGEVTLTPWTEVDVPEAI